MSARERAAKNLTESGAPDWTQAKAMQGVGWAIIAAAEILAAAIDRHAAETKPSGPIRWTVEATHNGGSDD